MATPRGRVSLSRRLVGVLRSGTIRKQDAEGYVELGTLARLVGASEADILATVAWSQRKHDGEWYFERRRFHRRTFVACIASSRAVAAAAAADNSDDDWGVWPGAAAPGVYVHDNEEEQEEEYEPDVAAAAAADNSDDDWGVWQGPYTEGEKEEGECKQEGQEEEDEQTVAEADAWGGWSARDAWDVAREASKSAPSSSTDLGSVVASQQEALRFVLQEMSRQQDELQEIGRQRLQQEMEEAERVQQQDQGEQERRRRQQEEMEEAEREHAGHQARKRALEEKGMALAAELEQKRRRFPPPRGFPAGFPASVPPPPGFPPPPRFPRVPPGFPPIPPPRGFPRFPPPGFPRFG